MGTFDHEAEKNDKRKGYLPYYSKKMMREVQFENMKI